jgi:predicted MPP superfamily phosphohydrolase
MKRASRGLFFSGCAAHTVEYTLETPAFEPGGGLTVVLISDLHSAVFAADQEPLVKAITQAEPDIILLTGDIFDSRIARAGAVLLLERIAGRAPLFYVTGNHEYRSGDIERIRAALASFQVRILSDEYVALKLPGGGVIAAGTEDPCKARYDDSAYNQGAAMERAFRELDGMRGFKILAAHRPEYIELYRRYNFDLVVSGHTHGGQVRIPGILNGLYAPNQGFFPKYAGGLYRLGKTTLIISRGLAVNPFIPRIYNPPELVVIRIKAGV